MSEVVIEPATFEDLDELSGLLGDLFMEESDFKPDKEKQLRGLRLIFEQPNRGRVFVLRRDRTIVEPREDAEENWSAHVNEEGDKTLFVKANSWYMAANVPGKARQILFYVGGQPTYFGKLRDVAESGYEGFQFGSSNQYPSREMEDVA